MRRSKGQFSTSDLLEAVDFDEEFDRAERAETNVRKLFEGTVGCDGLVDLLVGYQSTVKSVKALGLDSKDSKSFNFLFRGPPGTGKTTTAKKMGKVFYDMGFLATAEVQECSATDLVGQYVGQTGPSDGVAIGPAFSPPSQDAENYWQQPNAKVAPMIA